MSLDEIKNNIDLFKYILITLRDNAVFIYPGTLFICVYNWINFKKTKINYSTLIIIVAISFVMVTAFSFILGRPYNKLSKFNHLILVIASSLIPIFLNWTKHQPWARSFLIKVGITASVADDGLSRMMLENEKPGNDVYRVFLDNLGIMYRGHIKYRDHGDEESGNICLASYARFVKDDSSEKKQGEPYEPGYKLDKDYSNDPKRWVMVKISDISRWEVLIKNQHNSEGNQ